MTRKAHTRYTVHPAAWGLTLWGIFVGEWLLVVAYLSALLAHESAHAIAAKWLGCHVGQMELTPFGAVARVDDLVGKPYIYQGLIALAGPVASLVHFLGGCIALRCLPLEIYPLAMLSIKANLALLLFNLLPVLPLDGGRILFSMLAGRLGAQRTGKYLCHAGIAAGLIMVLLSLYLAIGHKVYLLTCAMAGCYLCYAASQCAQTMTAQLIHSLLSKRSRLEGNAALPIKAVAVSGDATIHSLANQFSPGKMLQVHVVDPLYYTTIDVLNEKSLLDSILTNGNMTVLEALRLSKPVG